jgi:hypothetical protein
VTKYGFNPEENKVGEYLIRFFRERNVTEAESWLKVILTDSDWRIKLTFDNWAFKDIKKDKIEIHLQPLEDPKTGTLAWDLRKKAVISWQYKPWEPYSHKVGNQPEKSW